MYVFFLVTLLFSSHQFYVSDLHSLNTRLLAVETALQQITTGVSPILPFTPPFSSSNRGNGPSGGASGGAWAGCDTTVLSGTTLSISLDDLAKIWLDELDLDKSVYPSAHFSASAKMSRPDSGTSTHAKYHMALTSPYSPSNPSPNPVKLEPTQVSLQPFPPPHNHAYPETEMFTEEDTAASLLLPPTSIYSPTNSPSLSPSSSSTGSSIPFPSSCQNHIPPALLSHLPSAPHRRCLLDAVQRVLHLRPSFNFPHLRKRVEKMFDGEGLWETNGGKGSKAATARAIFFGPPPTTGSPRARMSPPSAGNASGGTPTPSISFFAAAAAAFALGTLVSSSSSPPSSPRTAPSKGGDTQGTDHSDPDTDQDPSHMVIDGDARPRRSHRPRPRSGFGADGGKPSAAYLYALSTQALGVQEARGGGFDLDYLVACLLQATFLVVRGGNGKATGLFPLVSVSLTYICFVT